MQSFHPLMVIQSSNVPIVKQCSMSLCKSCSQIWLLCWPLCFGVIIPEDWLFISSWTHSASTALQNCSSKPTELHVHRPPPLQTCWWFLWLACYTVRSSPQAVLSLKFSEADRCVMKMYRRSELQRAEMCSFPSKAQDFGFWFSFLFNRNRPKGTDDSES